MSTYDQLLDLADNLIQENGFEGFSYANLADGLGIRKASVHHHFPTKNDLGLAYCDKKREAFSSLEATIASLPPGLSQLSAYMNMFFGCSTQQGHMCGVHAMLSDSNLFTPELKDAVSDLAASELNILSGILRRGRDSGELSYGTTPEDMALIVSNAIKGGLLLDRTPPHDASIRTAAAIQQMLTEKK